MSDTAPSAPAPDGLSCPECRSTALEVTHTKRPCAGLVVRLRRCAECECRFRTAEQIVAVTRRGVRHKNSGYR